MESLLLEWDEKTLEAKALVKELRELLANSPTPLSLREGLKKFDQSTAKYTQTTESGEDIEKIATTAKMIAVYAQSIAQVIPNFKEASEDVKNLGRTLNQFAIEFRSLVENSPVEYKPLDIVEDDKSSVNLNSFQSIKKNLKQLANDHELHDQRIKKLLNENEIKIERIESLAKALEGEVQKETEKISELYKNSLLDIEDKKSQINEILGHVSGRAIAGDFEKSAADEKSMANLLRYIALGCMTLIVAVVAYSFWETTKSDFSWQNSAFRITLALMLSIPAAYLARESAKHREQQYSHQQTSLDLKAIAPYIASLPEDEQHKIKIQIAEKLFASRDFTKVGANAYPINTHEIMMEIIKKLDFKKT